MDDYARVFDLLPYRASRYGDGECVAGRTGPTVWRAWGVRECLDVIDRYSAALLEHGVGRGDRIAIAGANRPEWLFADLATQQIGAVTVPVFPTLSDGDYGFILRQSRARLCFVTDPAVHQRTDALRAELPDLQAVYSLTEPAGPRSWSARVEATSDDGRAGIAARRDAVCGEDVATIIYTSGTTGTPKGVMLTHHNLVSNIRAITAAIPLPPGGRGLSVLPLAHSFERMVSLGYIASGVAVYLLDDLAELSRQLSVVRPHYFAAVPRLIERMHEALVARGREQQGLRRRLFKRVMAIALRYDETRPLPPLDRLVMATAGRRVFGPWREALGGRVRLVLCGGARLEPRLCRFFAAAGMTLIEGYGLAETSTFVTANRVPAAQRRAGTVGLPVPGVEVRIADDGEVLVRGPNVMRGYLNRPELTAEAVDADGCLHTGDLGSLDDDGFLSLTGRKKDLFKLSVGKYIAPEALETHYRRSRYIAQIMIVGEDRKYVAALVVPDFDELEAWQRARGAPTGPHAALVADPEVRALVDREMTRLGRALGQVDRVKRYVLLPDDWTVRGGELSPTLKIRRYVLSRRYAAAIEHCYV